METKTKYNVGELIQVKGDRFGKKTKACLQVMEIWVQCCYTTTQIFYDCHIIVARKEYAHEYKTDGDFDWIVEHRIAEDERGSGWKRYREDQLTEITKEDQEIFLQ